MDRVRRAALVAATAALTATVVARPAPAASSVTSTGEVPSGSLVSESTDEAGSHFKKLPDASGWKPTPCAAQ